MSNLKTQPNDASVEAFLHAVENPRRREDGLTLLKLMKEATQREPVMWGSSIIGFGTYHYQYKSGRNGEWMMVGFSPRKQNMTLYIMGGFEKYDDLLGQLGKHKTGKSCLYINKLDDVDLDVLRELVVEAIVHMESTQEQSG